MTCISASKVRRIQSFGNWQGCQWHRRALRTLSCNGNRHSAVIPIVWQREVIVEKLVRKGANLVSYRMIGSEWATGFRTRCSAGLILKSWIAPSFLKTQAGLNRLELDITVIHWWCCCHSTTPHIIGGWSCCFCRRYIVTHFFFLVVLISLNHPYRLPHLQSVTAATSSLKLPV